jgi:hypothetical protein
VVGCCECGDEPSGSCATDLVSYMINNIQKVLASCTQEIYSKLLGKFCFLLHYVP